MDLTVETINSAAGWVLHRDRWDHASIRLSIKIPQTNWMAKKKSRLWEDWYTLLKLFQYVLVILDSCQSLEGTWEHRDRAGRERRHFAGGKWKKVRRSAGRQPLPRYKKLALTKRYKEDFYQGCSSNSSTSRTKLICITSRFQNRQQSGG